MLAVLALALISSSPAAAPAPAPAPASAPAPERVQVLVLDLEAPDLAQDKIELIGGSVAAALAKRSDLEALTAGDLRAMTELEADKAAVGCDQASCLAELASALGTRYVIYGRIGSLGEELIMQVNLFDAVASKAIAREQRQAQDLSALSAEIPALIDALLLPLGAHVEAAAHPNRDRAPPPPPEGPPLSSLAVTGIGLAIVGGVVAVGAGVGAGSLEATLWSEGGDLAAKQSAYDTAPWLWATTLGGVVVAGVGATLLLLPSDAP